MEERIKKLEMEIKKVNKTLINHHQRLCLNTLCIKTIREMLG